MLTRLEELNIDKTCLSEPGPDFIESVGIPTVSGDEHIHGKDGAVLWSGPVRVHHMVPDDDPAPWIERPKNL